MYLTEQQRWTHAVRKATCYLIQTCAAVVGGVPGAESAVGADRVDRRSLTLPDAEMLRGGWVLAIGTIGGCIESCDMPRLSVYEDVVRKTDIAMYAVKQAWLHRTVAA